MAAEVKLLICPWIFDTLLAVENTVATVNRRLKVWPQGLLRPHCRLSPCHGFSLFPWIYHLWGFNLTYQWSLGITANPEFLYYYCEVGLSDGWSILQLGRPTSLASISRLACFPLEPWPCTATRNKLERGGGFGGRLTRLLHACELKLFEHQDRDYLHFISSSIKAP